MFSTGAPSRSSPQCFCPSARSPCPRLVLTTHPQAHHCPTQASRGAFFSHLFSPERVVAHARPLSRARFSSDYGSATGDVAAVSVTSQWDWKPHLERGGSSRCLRSLPTSNSTPTGQLLVPCLPAQAELDARQHLTPCTCPLCEPPPRCHAHLVLEVSAP
ncbi:hypothetical protein FRC08_018106 [Ceratobasidium sp. 394]|nr:hypothetical protein FRC08_018106 [Ceratobasidium sp. 394]